MKPIVPIKRQPSYTRISVTEKGRNLARELRENLELETRHLYSANKSPQQSKKKLVATDRVTIDSFLGKSTAENYQSFARDVVQAGRDENSLREFFLPEIKRDEMPKYLKQKIDVISRKIANEKIPGALVDTSLGKRSQSSSHLLNSSRINKSNNDSILDTRDEYGKYNKMVYNEVYLERLVDRYNKYLGKSETLQKRLHENYERNKEKMLAEQRRPPEYFDHSKITDPTLMNALLRETKYNERKKERVEYLHKKRYRAIWKKVFIPLEGEEREGK